MTGAFQGTQKARRTRRAPSSLADRPQNSIVWLASYPKSGNTWTRVFLANYLLNAHQPLPINQVHRIGIGDSVSGAYWAVGGKRYDPKDYVGHLRMREKVLRGVVANGASINFLKTHNARLRVLGTDLIPTRYTRSAVYIIRNPLDVAVSYARHYGISTDEAAARISRADNGIAADSTTVQQYLSDWSGHVRSWTGSRDMPVHVMRFEDMKSSPEKCFSDLLRFLGVPVEPDRLNRAVRFSSFEEMRRQESATPFRERSPNAERFFHSGENGQWKSALRPETADEIRRTHRSVMDHFGYL